jgi:hypothetical protein
MMRAVAPSRGHQGEGTTLDCGRQICARITSRGSFSTPARALFQFQSVCFGKSETRCATTVLNGFSDIQPAKWWGSRLRGFREAMANLSLAQREIARIGRILAQSLGIFRFSGQPALCAVADIVDEAVVLCRDRIEPNGHRGMESKETMCPNTRG